MYIIYTILYSELNIIYLYKCIELDTNIYSLYIKSKSVVYLYDINYLNYIMVKITIII